MRRSFSILLIFSIIVILTGCQKPATDSLALSKPESTNNINQWIDVPYNKADTDKEQQSVDEGHTPLRCDPKEVTVDFLYNVLNIRSLFVQVKDTQNGICNASATLVDGRKMEFQLIQPATKGSLGIWIVTKYRYTNSYNINQWIDVPYNKADTDKLQQSVDEGHRVEEHDPEQVAMEFLTYNLMIKNPSASQIKSTQNGICTVSATLKDGRKMEFQLIQPATKGELGIWTVIKYRYVN